MTTLTRWDPKKEAMTLSEAIDRFFYDPFTFRFPEMRRFETVEPKIDLVEEEDAYVLKASVPGVKPEEIEVTLQHNILTIKGETEEKEEVNEENYHLRERRYGSFMRSIMLPSEVKAEGVEAKNEHGVLIVHLPKSKVVTPTKIAVKPATAEGKTPAKTPEAPKVKEAHKGKEAATNGKAPAKAVAQ